MERFKVEVENDVYKGTYYGEKLRTTDLNGDTTVLVYEPDGTYTAHRSIYVTNIELVEVEE